MIKESFYVIIKKDLKKMPGKYSYSDGNTID